MKYGLRMCAVSAVLQSVSLVPCRALPLAFAACDGVVIGA